MSFWSLAFSALIHVGCVGLFFFKDSLGIKTKPIVLEASQDCTVPLEVTAVSDISTAPISRPKIRDNIKPPSDDPEKQVVEHLLPEDDPKPDLEPAVVEDKVKDEPKPIPQPEKVVHKPVQKVVKPEPALEPVKIEKKVIKQPKPKQVKIDKKAPKPKKEIKKKQSKKKDSVTIGKNNAKKKRPPADFISVLNNVDKDLEEGSSAETPITDPDSDSYYGAPAIGESLSLSMIDRVRRLLENAWHVPVGGNDGKALVVMVSIDMNRNGTVKNVTIDHSRSTPQHAIYDLACESALRAVNQFRTHPLPLPKELYTQWKKFEFKFTRK